MAMQCSAVRRSSMECSTVRRLGCPISFLLLVPHPPGSHHDSQHGVATPTTSSLACYCDRLQHCLLTCQLHTALSACIVPYAIHPSLSSPLRFPSQHAQAASPSPGGQAGSSSARRGSLSPIRMALRFMAGAGDRQSPSAAPPAGALGDNARDDGDADGDGDGDAGVGRTTSTPSRFYSPSRHDSGSGWGGVSSRADERRGGERREEGRASAPASSVGAGGVPVAPWTPTPRIEVLAEEGEAEEGGPSAAVRGHQRLPPSTKVRAG